MFIGKNNYFHTIFTVQKMKFSIKYFSGKCDQICRKLRIWSHLLEKSLMENFIFYAVIIISSCFLLLFLSNYFFLFE